MRASRNVADDDSRLVNFDARAQLRLVGIGPLSWMQGYEHALSAVRLLIERGVACAYRIVGCGVYFDAVAFAAHQLGLVGCVDLVQPHPRADLRAHLRWAEVLIDSSVAAVSPRPIFDAHAAGVPVVTTEPAHSDAALVVPRRDPGAICDALDALVRDGGLRARLVAAGRRRALQRQNEVFQVPRG
jgi:colanic acid/amylovoran biosynthesis glycosyltransferase